MEPLEEGGPATPLLHGAALPAEVLEKVYLRNAEKLLQQTVVVA